jgi:hypothetical protein
MLCQIEKACRYAERFDRIVVVETDYRFTHTFKDRLSKYFVSQQARLMSDTAQAGVAIDTADVFPTFLAGRIRRYDARFDVQVSNYVEMETGLPITFDFGRDYGERLLVHHQAGGGQLAIGALARMRLHDALVERLLERLRRIDPLYAGIHIRATDYRSRYRPSIEELVQEITGPVFLATDNRGALEECRAVFGADRVHSFSRLPAEAGRPLHYSDEFHDRFEVNCDSILDLVMLGLAASYYAFELEENSFGSKHSGFSLLAANLNRAKPMIARLVGRSDPVLDRLLWPFD